MDKTVLGFNAKKINIKQECQRKNNLTIWHVRIKIAMEKQQHFTFVLSLNYM
jgi:hypothetical protein